jgi:tRNA(Ile)-lysidine synthase TilS/MesJ
MELIRPMYLIREKDIIAWRDYNNLKFLQCACKFTETIKLEKENADKLSSKRQKIKELIASLKQDDPQIEYNIFRSVENVNLSTIIEYKDKDGVTHNFKDDYDK